MVLWDLMGVMLVMLNEGKHPKGVGILRYAQNDKPRKILKPLFKI